MPSLCGHPKCTKRASYGEVGGKAELCAEHAKNGMMDLRHKRCGHSRCTKWPSYDGQVGRKAELCAEHAKDQMIDVRKTRCGHSGCTKQPSYGKVGGKAELCAEHAKDGMVNARKTRFGHSECTKLPSFSVEGSRCRMFAPNTPRRAAGPLERKGAAEGVGDLVNTRGRVLRSTRWCRPKAAWRISSVHAKRSFLRPH